MTPLEDRVRAAIQARASQVPPEAVPPLWLPARRRRFFSPAHGGGGKTGAPARRGWLIPVAAALGVAAAVLVPAVVSGRIGGGGPAARAQPVARAQPASQRWRNDAARWVAGQVSPSASVSCDPLMCRELRASGFPAGRLLELRSGADSPLGSSVIVATARIRSDFGGRLTAVYAPQVLARFGSGDARVAVRVIAPDGPAAYRRAFFTDLALRKQSGTELLTSNRIAAAPMAFRRVEAGQVDSRLLIAMTELEVQEPLEILAFDDSGPEAAPDIPLRAVTLRPLPLARCSSSGSGPSLIKDLHQMPPQFHPQQAGIVRRLPGGCAEIRIEFPAPSPLGLLAGGSG
jgi:hypothetical protein